MQICRSSTKNCTEIEWKFVKITKSKKSWNSKCVRNLTFNFGFEPNLTILLPTFFYITDTWCMQLGYFKVKEVASLRPILLQPRFIPGRIWPKNNNTFKGPWVLYPYQDSRKSIKRFWTRSRKCKFLTDDKRNDSQKDGGTDDGLISTMDCAWSQMCNWAFALCALKVPVA